MLVQPIEDSQRIILYDGICNLCNGTMSFLTRIDTKNKLLMIPLQSDEGKHFLNKFSLSDKELSSVVFVCGDTMFMKS